MNLILLDSAPLNDEIELDERQSLHLRNVLKVNENSTVQVGLVGGDIGTARPSGFEKKRLCLRDICLDTAPPPALPLTMILALPRPQMIKRILQCVAIFGIEKLILIQTARVEKNYWQSPSVSDSAIREQLMLGLEQAKSTNLPKVEKHLKFKSFLEDYSAKPPLNAKAYVAHPGDFPMCPSAQSHQHSVIAIGPEGGFNQEEITAFTDLNFSPIQLGKRILKVETAVNAILGRWI